MGRFFVGPSDQILISERAKDLFGRTVVSGFEKFDKVSVVRVVRHATINEPTPTYWLANHRS